MAGILVALDTVRQVISKNEVEITQDQVEKLENIETLFTTNGSITKLLSKFVIEPTLICSKGVRQSKVFDKLLQVNLDIFSAFYMQAFQILKDVYGLDSRLTFDVLSTDTGVDLTNVLKGGLLTLSRNSYDEVFSNNKFLTFSMEKDDGEKDLTKELDKINDNLYGTLQKQLNVNVSYGDKGNKQVIQIPITVKAFVIVTDTENIVNFLRPNATDKTFWARLDEYRAGAISLKELLFCGDIIAEYKKNRLRDKDSLSAILTSRQMSSQLKRIATKGMAGYEASYNMLIVTSDDKVRLDRHINGDISKEANKQKILEEASAMTISIADDDYERVNIYTRDIRGSSDVGYKALSKRKDKDGENLGEILKSLLMSKPMSF